MHGRVMQGISGQRKDNFRLFTYYLIFQARCAGFLFLQSACPSQSK